MQLVFHNKSEDEIFTYKNAIGEMVFYSFKKNSGDTNEDCLAIIPIGEKGFWLAVADGAGGHRMAAKAASLVIESLEHANLQEGNLDHFLQVSMNTIEQSNQKILDLGVGARTTIGLACIYENTFRTIHAGDTEIIAFGGLGKLKYRSMSHSPIGLALEAGLENELPFKEEYKYEVTNLLGDANVKFEISMKMDFSPHDTILIASDGLTDNLSIERICKYVRERDLLKVAENLKNKTLANMYAEGGKEDDLSFILYRPLANGESI